MSLKTEPLYRRWSWIIQAKFNPNCPDYWYGHKLELGFNNFDQFKHYIEELPKPTPQHKILQRIDQAVGWIPGNLRWSNNKQASNNRRCCDFITHNNQTHSKKEWSEVLDIGYWTINHFLDRGYTLQQIIDRKNKYAIN